MSRRLLIDGDSLAKSPATGRLSIARLDSAVGFLRREITGADLRVTLVISHEFGQAMTGAQRARLDRVVAGTFQVLPAGVHLRDFIVRGADDGAAIVVSNNAFSRQREAFPWLTDPGNGRHILARRHDEQSEWVFVEARALDSDRRTLGEIVGATTYVATSASDTSRETPVADGTTDEVAPENEPSESDPESDGTPSDDASVEEDLAEAAERSGSARAVTGQDDVPQTHTAGDLCALFGVDAEYVLALINRGQGPNVSRLDQKLPDRTASRVTRLLTDDINRYQRRISDVPKLRKVDIEDVRRRARNSHVPLALRPGGDRTTAAGFSTLLDRFSSPQEQHPPSQSVREIASRYEVDVQYVIAIAEMHTKDRVTAASTLTKGLAGLVRQTLEFDLFPFSRTLATAAEHLGTDVQTVKTIAEELSITLANRPEGTRLSAGDYHRLMVHAWPMRTGGTPWEPPEGAAPSRQGEPAAEEGKPPGQQSGSTAGSPLPPPTAPSTSSTSGSGDKPGFWKRNPFSRTKKK